MILNKVTVSSVDLRVHRYGNEQDLVVRSRRNMLCSETKHLCSNTSEQVSESMVITWSPLEQVFTETSHNHHVQFRKASHVFVIVPNISVVNHLSYSRHHITLPSPIIASICSKRRSFPLLTTQSNKPRLFMRERNLLLTRKPSKL